MIQKVPEMTNVAKDDGYTALHLCATNGHRAVAESLIKVDFLHDGGASCCHVLILSGLYNNKEINNNKYAQTFSGQQISLSFDKHPQAINRFNRLQGKANLEMEDSDGLTALLVAVSQGQASVVEVLVINGKPLRWADRDCLINEINMLDLERNSLGCNVKCLRVLYNNRLI